MNWLNLVLGWGHGSCMILCQDVRKLADALLASVQDKGWTRSTRSASQWWQDIRVLMVISLSRLHMVTACYCITCTFAMTCIYCVYCAFHMYIYLGTWQRRMTKAHDKGTWQRHMTKAHDKHTLPHRWLHKMTWTTFVFFTTWLRRTTTMPWWCQIEELLRWEKKQRQSLGCDPDRYGRKTLWNEAWTLWRFGKGIQTMCCTQCPGGVMAEVLWLGSDEFSEMSDVEWWQMLMTNVDKGQEVTKEYSKTSLGQNLRRLGSQDGCWSC